jgi:hypothetical protein
MFKSHGRGGGILLAPNGICSRRHVASSGSGICRKSGQHGGVGICSICGHGMDGGCRGSVCSTGSGQTQSGMRVGMVLMQAFILPEFGSPILKPDLHTGFGQIDASGQIFSEKMKGIYKTTAFFIAEIFLYFFKAFYLSFTSFLDIICHLSFVICHFIF